MRAALLAVIAILIGNAPASAASCGDQVMKRVITCMAGDLDKAVSCRAAAEAVPCQPDTAGSEQPPDQAQALKCGPGEYRWIPGYGEAARCAPYAKGSGTVQRSRESGISGR
ncbi:hypothetical protein [Bradyrhizobium centrosematis]|uniref:hypothetical protein n=1 Tax=Bradyrhizobium centrosematis TaxID=1300039 RepID=UPI00216A50FE|nr:hypothetical protein [Bradyrhizobium centrosematis]MCS3761565.1 hypothetical protein [Bradyrhizobium centrosematis]MCS3774233.1 hypothetical protein [Bradyrhizobium centrosematis]